MFGELKAKLAAIEGKLRLLLATIEGQAKLVEKDAATMDAEALAILGRVDANIKKAESEGKQKLGGARAMLKKMSPPA